MVEMIWHTNVKAKAATKRSPLSRKPLVVTTKQVHKSEKQHEVKNFIDLMKSYWQKYCQNSTIHGVRYIYDPDLRSIERFIWTAVVLTCVTLTCYSYVILSKRYVAKNLQTIVEDSQYPVFKIEFPAVGICTQNRINWEKFEQAKATFLPNSADDAQVNVFTEFVQRMETLSFGQFNAFKDMEDINLELLENIDVSNLAHFMSITCEDILVPGSCLWRKVPFDCCSRFIMENTEEGFCLVFNSKMSKESALLVENLGKQFYPYHTSQSGQNTGLNFRLKLDSKLKRPNSKAEDSVKILIKRPEQLMSQGYTIIPNTATYFIVRPQITSSDNDLRSLDPKRRNCYFEDETYLLNYKLKLSNGCMLRNCRTQCHEEHMIQYCNCSLPLFFLRYEGETANRCKPSKFRCLAKNNDIFSSDKRKEEDAYFSSINPGMTCSCLIPCNMLEYFTSLTTLPLQNESTNDTACDVYDVDVHYQSDVLIQYRTSLEFTVIDLIANFGGIIGLCLGASLVSAFELVYYATFGFGYYLYDNNYFAILKTNLKNFFVREEQVDRVLQLKRHHPLHKDNRW